MTPMIEWMGCSLILIAITYYAFRQGVRLGAELTIKRLIEEKYILVKKLKNGDLEFIRQTPLPELSDEDKF
jgi:hypothetical protein